jgi:hypothetical protein
VCLVDGEIQARTGCPFSLSSFFVLFEMAPSLSPSGVGIAISGSSDGSTARPTVAHTATLGCIKNPSTRALLLQPT